MKKTVLITGGSRGIGAETVKNFSKNKYKVVFFYNENKALAEKLCQEYDAVGIQCDVSDYTMVKKAVENAKVMAGTAGFDALVCNAGISVITTFGEMTIEQWHQVMDVNLNGTYYVIKEVLPDMLRNKRGKIVLVSSMWGQVGASCEVAYSTSKAGIIGLTKSLAKETALSGISVNCVAPGVIDTDMNKEISNIDMEAIREEIPMGRLGGSNEVAKAIAFLASEEASYITGQIVGVNGGLIT